MNVGRRGFLKSAGLVGAGLLTGHPSTWAAEDPFNQYPPDVAAYLNRIYSIEKQRFCYRPDYPGGFSQWQTDARPVLKDLIGLSRVEAENAGFTPRAEIENEAEDLGSFTRALGSIETEPNVRLPFYLLKPKGNGPFPLAVLPHGHGTRGYRPYAGVYTDEAERERGVERHSDVGIQAAKRGFLAIAPATRGLGVDSVPDVQGRHGDRPCRSQLIHCLLAGRTPIGERVWDMKNILDWATALPEVDESKVLMMGNSGGGMVTLYAAACDERVKVAVPSCSFTSLTSETGFVYHCDCNLVPGMMEFGRLSDVAGLVAPRSFLAVNGRQDELHSETDIEKAASEAQTIFAAAGVPKRFEHRWGDEGHRFYPELMWPFVLEAFAG